LNRSLAQLQLATGPDSRLRSPSEDHEPKTKKLTYPYNNNNNNNNKTAELSQRRPRKAPNIWVPWKVLSPHLRTRLLFQKFVMDFCSDWMCVQNLNFVALPVP